MKARDRTKIINACRESTRVERPISKTKSNVDNLKYELRKFENYIWRKTPKIFNRTKFDLIPRQTVNKVLSYYVRRNSFRHFP